MQLKIYIDLKENDLTLPLNYGHILQGIIYSSLYNDIEYQKKIGRYPTKENWNSYTEAELYQNRNFNQLSACERRVSAPLYGVTVRGMLWFQGCSNCMIECEHGMYAKTLSVLRDAWCERFGIPGEGFPVFFSTIYPHVYGKELIAHGRFNQSLVSLTKNEPEKYYLLTNTDLSPIWAMHTRNHPVHGIHKYQLGERFAAAALASVYRNEPRADAAILEEVTRCDGHLLLRRSDGTLSRYAFKEVEQPMG